MTTRRWLLLAVEALLTLALCSGIGAMLDHGAMPWIVGFPLGTAAGFAAIGLGAAVVRTVVH